MSRSHAELWLSIGLLACGREPIDPRPVPTGVFVTFNTGTTQGLPHDESLSDGYGAEQADLSDELYGDGLAWQAAIDQTVTFFAELSPDVVGFQEMFYSGDCAVIPSDKVEGFVCEHYQPGAPTVAQVVLGPGYQVGCHLGKPDKCLAVRRAFGSLRGCDADLCLDFLDGAEVDGCGSGSRVGRAVIDLAEGGELTVVNLHGTSGISDDDVGCRVAQFEQVFVDLGLGDGPAANGARNVVLGDFNTDPARAAAFDASVQRLLELVGDDKSFHFVTAIGQDAVPTYANAFNIDHVISDALDGECRHPGAEGHGPPVLDFVYFDHLPAVCTLELPPE